METQALQTEPRYAGLRVTREEYLDLEDDGFLYDMIEGVLCVTPGGSYEHGAPDLICETLSDSTAKRDPGIKAERYLSNGVKEYWIVDPRDKSMQECLRESLALRRLWLGRQRELGLFQRPVEVGQACWGTG